MTMSDKQWNSIKNYFNINKVRLIKTGMNGFLLILFDTIFLIKSESLYWTKTLFIF